MKLQSNSKAMSVLTAVLVVFTLVNAATVFAAPKTEAKQEVAPANVNVNVNTASAEELQTVRGIGPSLAERIVEYRNQNGKFQKVEDLVNIRGIGEAKFQKIKTQVSV